MEDNVTFSYPADTTVLLEEAEDQMESDIKLNKDQYQVIVLIYSVPLLLVMLGSIALLCLTIHYTNDLNIRNNMFLRSWILVDVIMMVVLVVLILMSSASNRLYEYGYRECVAAIAFTTFPIWLGQFHAVLCSYDRYVCILHSSNYETIFSKKRIFLFVLSGWLVSIFCSCIPLMFNASFSGRNTCSLLSLHKGYFIFISVVYFVLVSGVLAYFYIRIYMHVQHHNSQVHVTHTMAQEQLLTDARLAKIMFLNTILFVSLWLPFNIVCLAALGSVTTRKSWQTALLCSYFIGCVSSACKLFVFCALSNDFRILVANIVTLKHRVHPVTSSGMLS